MEALDRLAALIERNTGTDGTHVTAIPRLSLVRSSRPTEPLHGLAEPSLCIVAQGRKMAMLGEGIYEYDRAKYLLVSADLPVVGHVTEASEERPYLCVRLALDCGMLSAIMLEMAEGARPLSPATPPGLMLTPVTAELVDAMARLVALLDAPRDIGMLAPLAEREILYRLLTGEQQAQARHIAIRDGRLAQINKAIGWIRRNFAEAFRIEAVAAEAGMSASSLHHHFRAVTAMSPLQYQKRIRLQEARRLIVAEGKDAAQAGFSVGYDSPSQFSREYARLFGAPPLRDASRLRADPEYGLVA
ncbi:MULTISPECIES: AraC family transcriptional regulator [Sphingomonadales]|uniref:AraC family transcriptional regulator n=2 Tax=Edaphosphingomonas TaxID=3423724 RepID=A0A2T4I5Y5_9SPHN|nr:MULTISPECIES: AraC family transcriptional regulator [Sphingomonas]AGH49721.1 AraC-like transcriptional regulator [Sphingomonas sp. MM-1]MDX3886363.1 AraC family transcriptional regulator [Sphingomonas sp.]OHT18039.1 HTH-type transcriptional activator RhaS [Sphingomonas haloaromaticamans]PTD25791.1 AraC family transcriptional regulator [Sphingomonas fennica]